MRFTSLHIGQLLSRNRRTRSRSDETRCQVPSSRKVFVGVIVLGLLWYAIEFLHGLTSDPNFMMDIAFRNFLDRLPSQVVAFLLLAFATTWISRIASLRTHSVAGLALASATWLFLAPAVGLGVFRTTRSETVAILAVGLVGLGLLSLTLSIAQAARLLPRRLFSAWPPAFVAGWSLLAVPILRRLNAPLSLGAMPEEGAPVISSRDVVLTVCISAVIFLFCAFRRRCASSCASVVCLAAVLNFLPADASSSSPADSTSDRPHVIVILIDTLRADYVGKQGRRRSLTPNIDAIAQESVRFRHAVAPSNLTFGSLPAIMTGLPATIVGRRLSSQAKTLAEYLKEAGYNTYGFSANPLVSNYYGYDQGFDALHDPSAAPDYLITNLMRIAARVFAGPSYRLGVASSDLYYPPIQELRKRAELKFSTTDSPTFIYIQTMDPHGPYLPPKEFLPANYRQDDFYSYFDFLALKGTGILKSPGFKPHLVNLRHRYGAEIRHTDAQLGKLVDALRAASLWEESLVWILSDHGEAFGEDDHAGHSGRSVSRALLHVPFLLKPPKAAAELLPQNVDEAVSTADLLPTTLQLLGLPVPDILAKRALLDAHGLAASLRDRPACADVIFESDRLMSCIKWPWKLDLRFSRGPRALLLGQTMHNLEGNPGEPAEFDRVGSKVTQELGTLARERLAFEHNYQLQSPSEPLPPKLRRRLRNLGYVETR